MSGDFSGGGGVGVEGQVLVCGEGDGMAVNGGGGGVQVEVAELRISQKHRIWFVYVEKVGNDWSYL